MRTRLVAASRFAPPAPLGFTLSEVLVALTLLSCGALALAAASTGAVRAVSLAEAQERATMAARDRVERLASRGCTNLADGTTVDSGRGWREHWVVTPRRNGVRLVSDSVEHLDRAVGRSVVLHRLVVC